MRIARSTVVGTAVAVALFGANAFAQQGAAAQSSPGSASKTGASPSLQEIVVTGIRYSVKQSLAIKRAMTNMTEVATATDIGKLPDKNVADVLMRLPGVDTQSSAFGEGGFGENDRVSLRGTPASLALTTIDGHSVASADWFIEDQYQDVGRSVSYQLMPAEIVSKTVVNFGQKADLLAGGVAGSIDIQTRHPLDFKPGVTGFVNAGAAYTTLASKTTPQADAMLTWNNGTVGALVLGFYEKRDIRRDGQEFLGYAQVPSATAAAWQAANPNLPNAAGAYYPTLIGEALFTQTLKRAGGLIDLQARPSDSLSLDLTAFYSDLKADNDNNNFLYWGTQQFGSAGYVPTSLTIQNNYVTAAAFPTQAGAPPSAVYDQIYRPGAQAKTSFVNLDAKFRPMGGLTVDGQLGFTYALGNSPSQPAYEYYGGNGSSYRFHGDGRLATVNFYDLGPGGARVPLVTNNPAGFGVSWAWNDVVHTIDKEVYGKLDATLAVDHGPFEDLRFGARFAHHDRETAFNQDQGLNCWSGPPACAPVYSGGEYPGNYQSGLPGGGMWAGNIFENSEAAIAAFDTPTNLSHGPSRYYWQGSFNVAENNFAAYVMADVGGERWSGNFGLRVVNTLEEVTANVPGTEFTFSAFGPFSAKEIDNRYFNALPSVNFKFDLTTKLLLRVAAAETMSLPDYSTLGGAVILTDTNLTGSGGNPNLKPIKGAVYSTDLEYYYGPESMAEAGLFDMDLSSYVDFTNRQQLYLNMTLTGNGPPVYSTYTITSAVNEPAEIKGAFASWQQALPLGFGVNANFTLADGTTANGDPVQGDSKYTWNVGGYYQRGPISANLDYTYRSHYYVASYEGTQEFEDNWANLDAAVTWTVVHDLSVNFNAQNLTNEHIRYYANGNPGAPFAIYDNGRTFYLTAQYKF